MLTNDNLIFTNKADCCSFFVLKWWIECALLLNDTCSVKKILMPANTFRYIKKYEYLSKMSFLCSGEFSLTKELSLSSGKPLNRWQKRNTENDKQSHVDNDEQPESDIAKWVFDVLSISKVKNSPPICRPKLASSPPIPQQPEKKVS
jgi:hypothetical protein